MVKSTSLRASPAVASNRKRYWVGVESSKDDLLPLCSKPSSGILREKEEQRPFPFTLPLSDHHKPKAKDLALIVALGQAS